MSAGPPGQPNKPHHPGWIAFWILLFLPGLLSMGLWFGNLENSTLMIVTAYVLGPICILYCGIWPAFRLFPGIWARIGLALLFCIAVFIINFVLFFIGCTANFSLH